MTHPPRSLVAAIDQGTMSSRCILFSRDGRAVATHQQEHRQMSDAKEAALARLNARLSHVYDEVTAGRVDATQKAGLDVRANTLIPLRRTAHEMTTWPFADTVAFGRAVLIACAPLVYAALCEIIRVFWIAPMGR